MKDYKKIIKGVIEIIRTTEKTDIGFANICTYLSDNCDELFESEDERIRKELIDYIKGQKITPNHSIADEWIAWLEKQGCKQIMIDKACEWLNDKLDYCEIDCRDEEKFLKDFKEAMEK